jgi:putative transposase
LPQGADELRRWIDVGEAGLSVARQCELLGLPRSTYYYVAAAASEEDLQLMRAIDEQYLKTPFFGSRRMAITLSEPGRPVNRKRVQRLMREMGIEAIYPRKTTVRAEGHRVYPYLLRGLRIDRPNQVWCSDITYVPLRQGFMYLVAVMDWHSRHVLSWRLSNSLDATFCLDALEDALSEHRPDIFNTDQGSQFTSGAFTSCLQRHGVAISMDGRGRALDNVFIERLWRTVKYEEIYLKDYPNVVDLEQGLARYFEFYSRERRHQGLGYRTPWDVFHDRGNASDKQRQRDLLSPAIAT